MKWEAKLVVYKKEHRIAVFFEKDSALIARIKQLNGSRWSQSMKCWHVPDTDAYRERFGLLLKGESLVNEEGIQAIEQFKRYLKSKRYSESTIRTYGDALRSFLVFFKHKSIDSISNTDVVDYNNEFILKNKFSTSFQNQVVNAIKLYFKTIQNKAIDIEKIHRPKREKLLPNVLSKEEVKAILEAHTNIKHKAMLSLIYSCGLRRSELINLRLIDIDSKRNIVIIRQAKGKKDRITPLSAKILDLLRAYFIEYKPQTYLFEGQKGNCKYSERSLEEVLKKSLKLASIKKPVTLHWLRHSYATHLLESGTDLRYIQELLGHNSSRTTEIYTHVSTKSIQQIKSPFDDL